MKKSILSVIAAVLLSGLGGCDFLMGPDSPAGNGGGNLTISFGAGGAGNERAISSGADLPADVLAALRYELVLTGPGGEALEKTVSGGESLSLTAALGEWRIEAKAYRQGALAGTGSLSFTVAQGINSVRVPMMINGGYFDIIPDPSPSGGTVEANFRAAFPGTTVTL
ncbi:MAG: hypothetical protein LBP27_02190, partial [Treponema sp.]|nr:hypothetical protein [Treponema sp.]